MTPEYDETDVAFSILVNALVELIDENTDVSKNMPAVTGEFNDVLGLLAGGLAFVTDRGLDKDQDGLQKFMLMVLFWVLHWFMAANEPTGLDDDGRPLN